MAIQYTPALKIPYRELEDDAKIMSRDFPAAVLKIDSWGAQVAGESKAALSAGEAAEALAAAALARAEKVEFPIEAGTTPPEDEDKLWVDEGADGGGTVVTSEDISDATAVGRSVLTAPLAVNARNALAIFTGTRALLDEGTDTAERTWDAKELHEYVTDQVAAGGGAASWDDLTGKPTSFPPAEHTHDDRYYTEAEVDAKIAAIVATLTPYSSGLRAVPVAATWSGGAGRAWRVGSTVNVSFSGLARTTDATGIETVFTLPAGWLPPAQVSGYTWRGKNCRILTSGAVQVYAPGRSTDDFSFSYSTLETPSPVPLGSTA